MRYLLDTCVLSEFTKPRPSASVDRWLSEVPDASQFVSVLTWGELERGIGKLAAGRRRSSLERWFEALRLRMADRTLVVDEAVAREWGRVSAREERVGRKLPVIDAILGATATVHRLTVATRNVADFARLGVEVADPWRRRPVLC